MLHHVEYRCDVVYQTRIQRKWFGERLGLYKAAYIQGTVRSDAEYVIMHPLPIFDEVS